MNNRKSGTIVYAAAAFVIALGILLVLGFLEARAHSRDSRRVSDLTQITNALTLYIDAENVYPSGCEWSTEPCWRSFLETYIAHIPQDPVNRSTGNCESEPGCLVYRYCSLGKGRAFVLAANLEKPRKKTMAQHPDCPIGGPNQYWVTN